MSSFSLHFDNVHSHSLVWFSSVCLVQCRQPVGLLVCTMTGEGAITLVKVLDRVCACVFQTEPTAYQAETQRSLSDGLPRHADRQLLGDDGRTPPHHCQVVCTHRLLLGLFPQVLVLIIAQPWDGLKVKTEQKRQRRSFDIFRVFVWILSE